MPSVSSRKSAAPRKSHHPLSGEVASATDDGVIAGENNSARYVDVATRLNNQRQDEGVSVGCRQCIRSAPAAVLQVTNLIVGKRSGLTHVRCLSLPIYCNVDNLELQDSLELSDEVRVERRFGAGAGCRRPEREQADRREQKRE